MIMGGPLNALAAKIAEVNKANGWFIGDRSFGDRSFGDDIALLHSEVSEAYEEYRNGHRPEEYYYFEDGCLWASSRNADGILRKPEGVPSELADVIIRVLDTCYRYDIDIDAAVAEKIEYNQHRGYRHGGKVV